MKRVIAIALALLLLTGCSPTPTGENTVTFYYPRKNLVYSFSDLPIGAEARDCADEALEYVLRQHGLTPGEDVNVDTSVQFNMMAGAFTGGNGDYVSLFEPTATEVERSGKGYVLLSIGQESGEIPYTAFFALKSTLNGERDMVQRFTNALYRGQQWVLTHSAGEIARAIVEQFPDTDLEVLTAVCQRHLDIDAWNAVPAMKQESFERLETVMETAGELEERVDFEQVVDNSFARAAMGET